MNLKKLCLLAMLAAGSMVFATVDLRTTIRDVYVEGTCEEAGIITFSVTGNDFPTATTTEPVYIRLRLDHAAVLCKTLVWQNIANPNDLTELPIYLPIEFEESLAGDTLAAPANTVSIVRWKRGEAEIWLLVQNPTGVWIENGGALDPPTANRRVRWTVGLTARSSWNNSSPAFAMSEANLPSATRDLLGLTTLEAVSTLICVDLSGSNLQPLPEPETVSMLNFDPISFDSSTLGVETANSAAGIFIGPQVQTSYSGDTRIARGYDFDCVGNLPDKFNPYVVARLCLVVGSGQQGVDNGVVCMTNNINVRINCGSWGFHRNSRVHLETEDDAAYGFPVELDGGGDPVDYNDIDPNIPIGIWVQLRSYALSLSIGNTIPYGSRGTLRNIGGNFYVTSDAEVQYSGVGELGSIDFNISATVCQWYQEDPDDVILDVCILASNRDTALDVAPFDGGGDAAIAADQALRCDPSLRKAFAFEWNFGAFLPCESIDCVRIFFPYLPKFFDTDFFAGVSYVNHGAGDLDVVYGNIYESDGTMWEVDFGSLPVRNLRTWLLADFDGAVAFVNAEDDTDVLIPTNDEGDLVFGDLRSSMFIVGCIIETDSLSASGADLDGYLLIGAGANINGSYTARNMEPGVDQIGDLPIQFDKKGTATFRDYSVQDALKMPHIFR
jgi:hypothetical protein